MHSDDEDETRNF